MKKSVSILIFEERTMEAIKVQLVVGQTIPSYEGLK